MCTVSIVPHASGYRLMCNRDEQRSRVRAIPPTLRRTGGRLAAFPIDPAGGGTWVGVNDAGLAIALLNRASGRRAGTAGQSRGRIVRRLLAEGSLRAACQAAHALELTRFNPFRLVLVTGGHCATITSDGRTLRDEHHRLNAPAVFTSSSLGDELVEGPRRQLFARLVLGAADAPLHGQVRFHRHQWRTRPEISVLMARHEAATVSRTTIDVTRCGQSLLYQPIQDGAEGRRECCFFL